jgi:hypothetical protein
MCLPKVFISMTLDQGRTQELCSEGVQQIVEDRGQRQRGYGGGSPLVKGSAQFARVKPVFLLGYYGCVFHGTGNSAQLCQNFGISGMGVGGFEPPKPPSVRHCSR